MLMCLSAHASGDASDGDDILIWEGAHCATVG